MIRAAWQILLTFCLLTFLGCASSQESGLIGKWVCKASGDRMELLADHTCTVSSMGFQYPGKWTVSKSDIKIEAGQVEMKGNFDGKNIITEDAIMHNKYVYEKVVASK
jgi:hypothetical protein